METKIELRKKIEALIPRMVELMPKERVQKEIMYALQQISTNEKLQQCDEISLMQSVINIAATGATLNPALKLAYIVPYKGKAQLVFSYIGLMKILKELNPNIRNIMPILVYEDEKFQYFPNENKIIHEKKFFKSEEEQKIRKLIAGYIVIEWKDNNISTLPPLEAWEIEKRLKVSPSYSSSYSPISNWKEDMQKKTLVRWSFKWLISEQEISAQVEKIIEIEDQEIDFSKQNKKLTISDILDGNQKENTIETTPNPENNSN